MKALEEVATAPGAIVKLDGSVPVPRVVVVAGVTGEPEGVLLEE